MLSEMKTALRKLIRGREMAFKITGISTTDQMEALQSLKLHMEAYQSKFTLLGICRLIINYQAEIQLILPKNQVRFRKFLEKWEAHIKYAHAYTNQNQSL